MIAIIFLIIYIFFIYLVINFNKTEIEEDDNFGDVNYYIDDMDNSYKGYTDSLDENDYKHLR